MNSLNQRRERMAPATPSLMFCLQFFLLQLLLLASHRTTLAQNIQLSDNYYCGANWFDASKNCHRHCPSGDNGDCADLGIGWQCFQFTGCYIPPEENDVEEDVLAEAPNNQYCGGGWIEAMVTCSKPCPTGTECSGGDRCYAATNCDKPLVELKSDMQVTMTGPSSAMDLEDIDIFIQTLYDTLQTELEKDNMKTENVDFTGQSVATRRELEDRYSGRKLKGWQENSLMISNVTQRMLQTGSSALDASIVITGVYRPPPYKDLDVIAEDSINRQGEKVVSTLRERGARAGRAYFNRVDGIEAISAADVTNRPTRSPTSKPTPAPTGPPTATPSMFPTSEPSAMPSSEPSRDLDQLILTGSADDLQLGGKTTSSYGFIFNVRTPEDSPTIVITGLDFYTGVTTPVNYEVWTKIGSFQGYKGNFDGWEQVSKGTIVGKGLGRYTPIPEEAFSPFTIPGGGGEQGTRAIYITLDEKSLVYKIGEGIYADEVIQVETPDVEVWEGESVLSYPFPDPIEYENFYRFPRQFLGAIRIDRLPCRPFSLYGPFFGDLPCPRVPTGSPTFPLPTQAPITEEPTISPTLPLLSDATRPPQPPTRSPSAQPTSSRTPTYSPSEPEPTSSPIVLTKANFVSVFRNVPPRPMNKREEEKFKQIMLSFLQTLTGDSMVIDDIEIWHQKPILDTSLVATKGKGSSSKNKDLRNGDDELLPQVYSLEVTVIMSISYFFLPSNLLGSMAAETIDDNQELLLSLFRGQNSFYGYFKQMNKVDSIAIDDVTIPPTQSPITQAEALEGAIIATEVLEEEPTGTNFAVFVGVGVAALWCCLTAISVTYVLKKRGEMEELRDMEELLAQEKQTKPVFTNDAEFEKTELEKADEEAPRNNMMRSPRRGEDKAVEYRQGSDEQVSNADSKSRVQPSQRVRSSCKSPPEAQSVTGSVTSVARSEHTSTSGRRRPRTSRTTSIRNSFTSSALRSSLTELKGSFNKSVKQVSRGVEAFRCDGILTSSRRSATATRHRSMRTSSTNGSVARSTTSVRVRRGDGSVRIINSSSSVASSVTSRVRRGDGNVSVSASVRKKIDNDSVANSVTSSRVTPRV